MPLTCQSNVILTRNVLIEILESSEHISYNLVNRWKPTSIILETQYGIPLQVGRWDFHASKTAGDKITSSQYLEVLTSSFPYVADNLNPQFPTSMCSSHHINKIQTKIHVKG
jgi:hypothetical protein